MAELKPCPFCGGEAQISTRMDEDIWSHNTVPYTRVGCVECEIGTEYRCQGWEPTAQEEWNRRAADDPCSSPNCDCEPGIECAGRAAARGVLVLDEPSGKGGG